MTLDPLLDLSPAELEALSAALRGGRLTWPPSRIGVQRVCDDVDGLDQALSDLAACGTSMTAAVALFDALAARARRRSAAEAVELVWSGPDVEGSPSRDTGAVVRELFHEARQRVLVVGYAVHRGSEIFSALARRMEEIEGLEVRLCLDVQRTWTDTTLADDLAQRFAERLRRSEWPGRRFPEVYFDPRSLELDPAERASLHAKLVVVDGRTSLITSANFTPAAQTKNVEAGVLVESSAIAERIEGQIRAMIEAGSLRRLI